jgi:hypothetical protein
MWATKMPSEGTFVDRVAWSGTIGVWSTGT